MVPSPAVPKYKFDQYYDDTESIALYKTCNHA